MTVAWIGFSLSISLLLGAAALLLETLLLRWERPTRGVWAGALFLSGSLPLAFLGGITVIRGAWTGSSLWVSGQTGIPLFGVQEFLSRLQFLADVFLPELTTFLWWMWVVTAVVVVLWLGYSWWDLVSRRSEWTRGTFEGLDCYYSEKTGPGLAGMIRYVLVVPAWLVEVEPEKRRIVAVHESEHQRRRDPWLMTFGYASLLLAPWNPILWWQRSRLRLAVEMDCDRRSIRKTGDPLKYGEALLDLAEHQTRWITAFSQSESHLIQRIKHLKGKLRPTGWGALGAGLAVGATLFLMWVAPMPISSPALPDEATSINEVVRSPTPYTTEPRCQNCEGLGEFPSVLRETRSEQGALEEILVPIYVDRRGEVLGAICRPRCSKKVESRLSDWMRQRRYSPPRIWGVAVPAWVPVSVRLPVGPE